MIGGEQDFTRQGIGKNELTHYGANPRYSTPLVAPTLNEILNPPAIVWPLTCLLFALIVLHLVREELKPITRAMVPALAQNASKNATVYMIAFTFGLSASLSAFYDMFKDLTAEQAAGLSWWQVVACLCKVANPFVVAALAYVLKPYGPEKAGTAPPFPTAVTP